MSTSTVKFTNFASTTLVGTYTAGNTALTVSNAAAFPQVTGSDWFYAVITDSLSAPTKREIVKVTNVSGSIFTCTRGQDGTSAQSWDTGSYIELRPVNAALQDLFDEAVTDATTGINALSSLTDVTVTVDSDNNGSGAFSVLSGPDTVLQVTNSGELIASPGYANIKDFGGDSTGVSDTSTAVSSAIAAGYKAIYFPRGTYNFTSGITVTNQSIRFFGDGPQASVLKVSGGASFTLISFVGRYKQFVCDQLVVDNLSIQNNANSGAAAGSAIKAVMNATYVLKADITGTIAVGDVVTGATSGATGTVLGFSVADGWIELDAGNTGTWDSDVGGGGTGENILVSGVTQATVEDGAGEAPHPWKQPYTSVYIDRVEIGNLVHDACFAKGIELDTCQMAKITNTFISGFMSDRYPGGTRSGIGIDIYSRWAINNGVKGTDINVENCVIYQCTKGIQVNNNASSSYNFTEGVHVNDCTILNCNTGVKIGDTSNAGADGLPGWFIEGNHITATDYGVDIQTVAQFAIDKNLIYAVGGTTFSGAKVVGPVTAGLQTDGVICNNTFIKAATYSGNTYGIKFEGGDATPGTLSVRVSTNSFEAFTNSVIGDANTVGVVVDPTNYVLSGGTHSITAAGNVTQGFSGHVGVNTTPPSGQSLSIPMLYMGNGVIGYSTLSSIQCNSYYDGANNKYLNTGYATAYNTTSSTGSHIWYTTSSGTAGNNITFNAKLELNTSGNLILNNATGIYFKDSGSTNRAVLQYWSDNAVYLQNTYTSGNIIIRSDGGGTVTVRKPDNTEDYFAVGADGRIYGSRLHNNASGLTGTAAQFIGSGTYTPTLAGVTNVASSTSGVCQWIRVGNVVTVSGKIAIDVTAAGATSLAIPLPINSSFTSDEQCAGTAHILNTGIANESAGIACDTTNDRALLVYRAVDTGNNAWAFTFTYVVV